MTELPNVTAFVELAKEIHGLGAAVTAGSSVTATLLTFLLTIILFLARLAFTRWAAQIEDYNVKHKEKLTVLSGSASGRSPDSSSSLEDKKK